MKPLPFVLRNNLIQVQFKFKRSFICILLAAFVAGGCFDDDLRKVTEYDYMRDRPLEVTRDAIILYSDSSRIKARMTAPLMKRYRHEKEQLELPDGLNMVFYEPFPDTSSHISALYGIRYINEQRTELKNNVVVINEKGDTLETEHLIWEEDKDRVYSNVLVKVTTPDEVIIAQGFESDPSFREYTFYEIKGTIRQ